MAFTLIDEKKNIWGCKLGDLTLEETKAIVADLRKGSCMKECIMFLDINTGRLVLNEDNSNYTKAKFDAIAFLAMDKKKQREFIERNPRDSVVKLLAQTVKVRESLQIIEIVRSYPVCDAGFNSHEFAFDKLVGSNPRAFQNLYEYGYIQGKRAERARRKEARISQAADAAGGINVSP